MPVVDEFVLRLLRVVQRISGQRLAGYFGFTAREMESVLLELVERGLIESDEEEIYLSPKGQELFKGLTEGDLPRLARSEEHTSELQSLMRISYAVFCLKKKKNAK